MRHSLKSFLVTVVASTFLHGQASIHPENMFMITKNVFAVTAFGHLYKIHLQTYLMGLGVLQLWFGPFV